MNINEQGAGFSEKAYRPLRTWPAVAFSVVATLVPLGLLNRITGFAIAPVYWVFALLCPLLISYFLSRKFVRMSERSRNLHRNLSCAHEALKQVAERDPLTQALNRRGFLQRLELSRAIDPGWLLLLDIDRFKTINDRHGHETGDHVLHTIATLLLGAVRTDDCVGRLGGEEFAIFLPCADRETALVMAENIRQRIADATFTGRSGAIHGITISMGVAYLAPSLSIPDCLRMTDIALYQAKNSGRNRVVIEESSPPEDDNITLCESQSIATP